MGVYLYFLYQFPSLPLSAGTARGARVRDAGNMPYARTAQGTRTYSEGKDLLALVSSPP